MFAQNSAILQLKYKKISLRRRLGLEIQRLVQKEIVEEHPLKQLFWECTLRCNLSCRHCGSDCKTVSGHPDMPMEDFLRVLDNIKSHTDSRLRRESDKTLSMSLPTQTADPRQVFVIITGGEPLMRDDLETCCQEIYARGFPWGLVTNAQALTPERFHRLVNAGMHAMTVSLDGLEDSHTWMRGKKDSFRHVVDAIHMLRDEPRVVWDIVTCVTERNYNELDAMRDFLLSEGVTTWRLLDVFPVGRAATSPGVLLTDEHFQGMLDFIRRNRKEGTIDVEYGCEGFVGEYELDVRPYAFFCKAGISVASVLVDGSISACSSIRSDYHQGNIYTDDFMDVWERRFDVYRNREWMRRDDCAECNMFSYCNGSGMHLRDGDGKLLQCHLRRI